MSLPNREFPRPSSLPIAVDELYGIMRLRGFNAAGFPVNMLAENDGTVRSQLILYDGSTQRRAKSETTGELDIVLHGKDSGGTIDPLRTNASQQLQVEAVGGATKCLGSSAPAATTETVLYTVPAGTSTRIHSFWVCNRGAIESMRVGISVGGGALANEDYVLYNVVVPGSDALSWASEKMWCLAAADEIRVRSSAGNLTYKVFGEEST